MVVVVVMVFMLMVLMFYSYSVSSVVLFMSRVDSSELMILKFVIRCIWL